jgi:hypothetical protein
LQRQVEFRWLRQLIDHPIELLSRKVAKLLRGVPRSLHEEGARKALLGRTALEAAATLWLGAGTGLIAPDLRHSVIMAFGSVGMPP